MRFLLLLCVSVLLTSAETGQCESGKCQDEAKITILRRSVVELFTHQTLGNATGYISKLAPNYKFIFNGVDDGKDWTNKEFVEDRFAIITNGQVKFLQPMTKLDENTVITTINWSLRVKATFEDFQFYAWNLKITFNAAGLVEKMDAIGDSIPLTYLEYSLEPTDYDMKAIVNGYLSTFKNRDVAGTFKFVTQELVVKRNGQPDVVQWQDMNFLNILHKRALSVTGKPTLFTVAGNRAAQVHVTWTFKMANNPADPIVVRDAWYVVFPTKKQNDPRIAVIHSVVDMPSLMAVYEPMNADIQALQAQFHEQAAAEQQAQTTQPVNG